MKKPCDNKAHRDRLPCLAPGENRCFGAICWGKERGAATKSVRFMSKCPWIDEVLAYWERKGYKD